MSQTYELGRYCKVGILQSFIPAWFDGINLWDATTGVASEIVLLWFATILILAGAILSWLAPAQRKQIRTSIILFGFSLSAAFLAAFLRSGGHSSPSGFLVGLAVLLEAIILINLASIFVFDVIFKAFRITLPRILRDLVLAVAYVTLILTYISYRGVNVSGIVATSAVITAVIAFSLQDTLGNIMGGLALQMERTINVGDWIAFDKYVGKVVELSWRQTTIETRRWDTVIIPNSQLMKNQVVIVGRRKGEPVQERQELYFHVDPRFTPQMVVTAVEGALRSSPMFGVATVPPPDCVLDEFKDSYIQYCVRYWLYNLSSDMPTSGEVRTRIYYGLRRAGIPVSIPAQRVFLTTETEDTRYLKDELEHTRKVDALRNVALFQNLTEEERRETARQLQRVLFMSGEEITRQGDIGYWLFIIEAGSAEVRVSSDGLTKVVATLKAGDLLGEMSLMTGEPRSATVVALEEVRCYRLDKESFDATLAARPEMAEEFSNVLAHRRVELDAVREGLDAESKRLRMAEMQSDIRARIYRFFGLQAKKARSLD